MKIVYRISEQDFTSAHDLFAANEKLSRRLSRRLLPWEGATVLVSLIFYLIAAPQWNAALVIGGVAVGLGLMYRGFALPRYFKRKFRKDHRFRNEFTAEISDDGVHIVTSFSDSQIKWNAFVRSLESGDIFLVFVSEMNFLIFPKRAVAPGEADQFRTLLQRNIVPAN